MESPVTTITDAGFADLGHSTSSTTGFTEYSYLFGGTLGSLDHVFASPAAQALVGGVDTWTINSYESVAYEYSRWNSNVEAFYSPDQFRASDHNPEVVKLVFPTPALTPTAQPTPAPSSTATASPVASSNPTESLTASPDAAATDGERSGNGGLAGTGAEGMIPAAVAGLALLLGGLVARRRPAER